MRIGYKKATMINPTFIRIIHQDEYDKFITANLIEGLFEYRPFTAEIGMGQMYCDNCDERQIGYINGVCDVYFKYVK